jgi:hypothetical protein
VDGKATEAVRRALAEALGVRPAAVTLRVGATSRNKIFLVDAANAEVNPRLTLLRDGAATRDRDGNADGDGDGDGNADGDGDGDGDRGADRDGVK